MIQRIRYCSQAGLRFTVALVVCCTLAGGANASHFSWLGHGGDVPGEFALLGDFVPTFYRILNEADPVWSRGTQTEELLNPKGQLVAKVTPKFRKQLDIEGSARLRDGRIINIADRVQGAYRYLILRDAPFGLGMPGYKLIPFRTVAVDPQQIKLGTVLFVPALVGIPLPTGETHDGYCFAHDTGKGIVGNRLDIFVGFEGDRANTFTKSGRVASFTPLQLYRVPGALAKKINDRFRNQFSVRE